LRSFSPPLASSGNPVLPAPPLHSAAKLTPRFDSAELGSVLPSPFLPDRIAKVSSQIQLCRGSLGFTLACLFELTREVFLPDQSGRIVRARRKLGKSYLKKTLWKFVHACAKQFGIRSAKANLLS
jgi:hypothetical protein